MNTDAGEKPRQDASSLVVIDLSVLVALISPVDRLHALVIDALDRFGENTDIGICRATLDRLEERLDVTEYAVRHLETVDIASFEAAYAKYSEQTLAFNYVESVRNSYNSFRLDLLISLAELIRERGIEILPTADYMASPGAKERAEQFIMCLREELGDTDEGRVEYAALLATTVASESEARGCRGLVWTVHPKAMQYELAARLAGFTGVVVGVAAVPFD